MDLDDLARARPLVEAVDVLRHDGADPAVLVELGEGTVAFVRLGPGERLEPEGVELPDPCRIPAERVDVRHLERVVPRPDPLRRAEVRDPRLGADAGAGEDDARLPAFKQLGEPRDAHASTVRDTLW